MAEASLRATREQILGYRLRASRLDMRVPLTAGSLRHSAWAGLTDSMPRAALLSLHARLESVQPTTWENPALVQVWGPRFSAYVVARDDTAPFTLGRMPRSGSRRRKAEELLARLAGFLGEGRMEYSAAGRAMGVPPNSLRYAALTGRVMIRWEGSGRPLIWVVDPPRVGEEEARRELVRRYLHIFGVGTIESFSNWAGVRAGEARATFGELAPELIPVATPVGDRVSLAANEAGLHAEPKPGTPVRLLPSGDTYYLLRGADRELLVPHESRRPLLWTSRVWPGAVVIGNEVVGTWRRNKGKVTISTWKRLTTAQRDATSAEAESFPLEEAISVAWD